MLGCYFNCPQKSCGRDAPNAENRGATRMSAGELHFANTPKRTSSRDINQQNAALLSEVESIEHMISITQQAKVEEIGELSACLQPKGINISAVNKMADSYLQNIPAAPEPLRITIPEDRPQERNRQLRAAIRVAEKRAMLSNEHMDIIISTFKAINIAPESVNFTNVNATSSAGAKQGASSTTAEASNGAGTPRASVSRLNSSIVSEQGEANSDCMTTAGHTASSMSAAIKRALAAHDLGSNGAGSASSKREELLASLMAEVMPIVGRLEVKYVDELEIVRHAQVEAEGALLGVKEEQAVKLEEHAMALTMQLMAQRKTGDDAKKQHILALQAMESEHALALERQEQEYQAAMEQLGLIQQPTNKVRGNRDTHTSSKEALETSPTSVSARVSTAPANQGKQQNSPLGVESRGGGADSCGGSPASTDEGAEAAAAEVEAEVEGAELVQMFSREAGCRDAARSARGDGDDSERKSAERRENLVLLQRQIQRERQEKLLAMHSAKTASHTLSPIQHAGGPGAAQV
jgi:hypothetical protein